MTTTLKDRNGSKLNKKVVVKKLLTTKPHTKKPLTKKPLTKKPLTKKPLAKKPLAKKNVTLHVKKPVKTQVIYTHKNKRGICKSQSKPIQLTKQQASQNTCKFYNMTKSQMVNRINKINKKIGI